MGAQQSRIIETWLCILRPPPFGVNREFTLALERPVITLGGGAAQHMATPSR